MSPQAARPEQVPVPIDVSSKQKRMRRRAPKPSRPPQLQFVIATEPSQFKDANTKKSVRSQAMLQYRYHQAEAQKRKGKERYTPKTVAALALSATGPAALDYKENGEHSPYDAALVGTEEWDIPPYIDPEEFQYETTAAAWLAANPQDSFTDPWFKTPQSVPLITQSWRYRRALTTTKENNVCPNNVVSYENSDQADEAFIKLILNKIVKLQAGRRVMGDGVDPFQVLPQFANRKLNSLFLIRSCNRIFVTKRMAEEWIPGLLRHPHLLLSGCVVVSTYLDMHSGHSGDSTRTSIVKAEILGFVNGRINDPETRLDPLTVICILHLWAGEMWSCDETTLRIHEDGLARLIDQRGGMQTLSGPMGISEIITACSYHTNIFRESMPPPLFFYFNVTRQGPVDKTAVLPESPLYCPRSEFFTIVQSDLCSEYTYELLCDMRDLTDLFLSYHDHLDTVEDVDDLHSHNTISTSSPYEYTQRMMEIQSRLAALPSAYSTGLPVSNDWVYECCRIAAIIYTTSIVLRVPFSTACDPSRLPILANSFGTDNPLPPRLTDILYQTLEKTNLKEIWKLMSGVFYWVTAVGAAAARTPAALDMSQWRPRSRDYRFAVWVRRCLIMFSTRAMVLLNFEYAGPVLGMQKKLLRVQELVGKRERRLVD